MSSGNRKWVTEQASLIGGIVDIYVENKTTLTGAVIASKTGDLTLDTGSLEFSNIKDKDISSNLGGGVNAGAGSESVNATYGFTDKRQTNFATIGEGTITVRDTEDTAAALEGLNRDVTIAQYNTKDGGLQGGFTVDTATLNLIGKTVEAVQDPLLAGATIVCDTITTVGVMLDDMSERNDKIIAGAKDLEKQTEVIVEKTGNAIEYGHYTTDGKVQYYVNMDGYENKVENGIAVNDNDKMIYYGAKAWVGEKLDTSEQNAANQSFGNVLHDDILGTYKSSDAKSVNNDIRILSSLDSGLAGDVNSTFAGIRETERNQKIIQENQYLADFKELDRSKTNEYLAQQGSDNTLLSLGVKAYVALNSRDNGDNIIVNNQSILSDDPNSPISKVLGAAKDTAHEIAVDLNSSGYPAGAAGWEIISKIIPSNLTILDVSMASGGIIGKIEGEVAEGSAQSLIRNNAEKGANFEKIAKESISSTQDDIVEQITIKTESGTKTRMDFVGLDKETGAIKLTESKGSDTAGFTPNQKIAHPEIEESGGVVVGKGKSPYVGGTVIPPTKVDVVRPKDLE